MPYRFLLATVRTHSSVYGWYLCFYAIFFIYLFSFFLCCIPPRERHNVNDVTGAPIRSTTPPMEIIGERSCHTNFHLFFSEKVKGDIAHDLFLNIIIAICCAVLTAVSVLHFIVFFLTVASWLLLYIITYRFLIHLCILDMKGQKKRNSIFQTKYSIHLWVEPRAGHYCIERPSANAISTRQ